MKVKNSRLETLRLIISTRQIGSQDELLNILKKEGFTLTQATLSRDLKQLKVAKASTLSGEYIYVLPNETMYRRVSKTRIDNDNMATSGLVSLQFSGNIGVIKTRPGYASAIAWNIDHGEFKHILGTIAGDDTIIIVMAEGATHEEVAQDISTIVEI